MSIDLGQSTAQIQTDEVTCAFQSRVYEADGTRISDPVVEIRRKIVKKVVTTTNPGEENETIEEETVVLPGEEVFILPVSKLPEILTHLQLSANLQSKFTQQEFEEIILNLPEILSASFDGVVRKVRADRQAVQLQQQARILAEAEAQAELAARFAQAQAETENEAP